MNAKNKEDLSLVADQIEKFALELTGLASVERNKYHNIPYNFQCTEKVRQRLYDAEIIKEGADELWKISGDLLSLCD